VKKLYVVGIGAGGKNDITVGADAALQEAGVICGYSGYIALLGDRYPGKLLLDTPMTKELERCKLALEQADQGKVVALVCSGDAGVYGMASPVLELAPTFPQVEIEVLPGVTAATSGAALLGAPLGHDFAVISLSDRLTPWELILKRLEAAAQADFVICLYNPASKGRPEHLARACDRLLAVLPPERPCAWARNIGRPGQGSCLLPLRELRETTVDMFTTVFIGNSQTQIIAGRMVTPRGYRGI
jgi:precorrin-3B C17-methyltransferase